MQRGLVESAVGRRVGRGSEASTDAYTFCIGHEGPLSCNQRQPLADGDWYSVSQTRIDRRRGSIRVTVDAYSDLLQGRQVFDYIGTCQRAPEQQF